MAPVKIGILAVQGGFAVHHAHLEAVGATGVEVRTPEGFDGLDGLILPGGESTTISKGIESAGLFEGIRRVHSEGLPILGTCAGMIVADRDHLGLIDITTRRNAFGRQLSSFEDEIDLPGITDRPVRAVFIRAPWVEEAGSSVEVLTELRGHPVAVREGAVTALSFHPELTGDDRIHAWFADECASNQPGAGSAGER